MNDAPIDMFRRDDGRLMLRETRDGLRVETPVQIACCFPWSRAREFVSIRDDKGKELALVGQLDELPAAVGRLIGEELDRRTFVPHIVAVSSIAEQAELFHWQVVTDAGPRGFLTARHEYLQTLSDGKVLIKDVGNDLYLVDDPSRLDAKSRRLLWAYLD